MPVTHSIDEEKKLSVITITGRVSVPELIDFIKERAANRSGGPLPVLVDAHGAEDHEFLITDMDFLARIAAELHGDNGNRREAFVASSERNAGLLSLFRKFSVNGHNQRLFENVDDAIAWLTEGGS